MFMMAEIFLGLPSMRRSDTMNPELLPGWDPKDELLCVELDLVSPEVRGVPIVWKYSLVCAAVMYPIFQTWLFRGCEQDFIGQIHSPSSKGQYFFVAIDYSTKCTGVVHLDNMTHKAGRWCFPG